MYAVCIRLMGGCKSTKSIQQDKTNLAATQEAGEILTIVNLKLQSVHYITLCPFSVLNYRIFHRSTFLCKTQTLKFWNNLTVDDVIWIPKSSHRLFLNIKIAR